MVRRELRGKLGELPARYQWVHMAALTPADDPAKCFAPVAVQRKVIEMLKSRPDGSYAFFGAAGVGKTVCLAALFRHAIETDPENLASTIYVTLAEVLRAFNSVAIGEKPEGKAWRAIQAPWQPARCRIFLDEFDKAATLSTFAFARVNEFVDKIYGRGDCQLCIASNMRRDELLGIWGSAVVRRVDELCTPLDFFETETAGACP